MDFPVVSYKMKGLINYLKRVFNEHLILILFLAVYCFFSIDPASGQSEFRKPLVGLALSGGGSSGIAHIGVLKVMEEAGLRPDYITGVSMGSIIGGLYSTGYSADSLEKVVKTIDWKLLMSNKIPEYKIIYPEKKHFYNSVISFPVTLKKSFIPPGLINGQQIENILSYYAWPALKINDFSDLPIPFMCLATNLLTCRKVELTRGYLPDAMRASSAVPTIFTPLKINNVPLIDGGMVRNLAVTEAREMGSEIVIGSYTGSYLSRRDELESITGILGQIFFFVGVYDFQDQKKYVDILIEPKTDDISSVVFSDIDTLIQRGYRAALPYKDKFRNIADSLDRLGPQKPLINILDNQTYKFDKIVINGNRKISSSQISGVLGIKPGQETDKNLLKNRIELLYGKAWFDKVKYRIVPRNDSLLLMIDCTEAPKTIFYGSVHYDNALHSGLVIGLSVKNPLIQRSLIDIDAYVGHYYKTYAEYSQFLNRSQKYSLSTSFYAENTFIPWFELYGNSGGTLNRVFSQNIALNKRFGLNHMLSLSVQYEKRNLIPSYFSDNRVKKLNHNYESASIEYNVNSLDNKHFPNNGTNFHFLAGISRLASGKLIKDNEIIRFAETGPGKKEFGEFLTISGNIDEYFSLSEKLSIGLGGNILYISDTDSISSQNNSYFLGGFQPINYRSISMTGFHPFQIPVKKLAGLRLSADYEIIDKLYLVFNADIFAVRNTENHNNTSFISGFGAGAGYMSILGPLRAGIMYGMMEGEKYYSRIKGYISLGYNF
jgi:NTE family protein